MLIPDAEDANIRRLWEYFDEEVKNKFFDLRVFLNL